MEQGLVKYQPLHKCTYGHRSLRYTKSGACIACNRLRPTRDKAADRRLQRRKRAEAIRNGQSYYYTGVPCKNGHRTPRNVSNHSCQGCERDRARIRRRGNALERFVAYVHAEDIPVLQELVDALNMARKLVD